MQHLTLPSPRGRQTVRVGAYGGNAARRSHKGRRNVTGAVRGTKDLACFVCGACLACHELSASGRGSEAEADTASSAGRSAAVRGREAVIND